MDIKLMFKQAEKFTSDNSPLILTIVGVAGAIGSTVLAAKATVKAVEIIEIERVEGIERDEIPFLEKAKLVWPLYVPTTLTLACTVTSVIYANRIGTRRAAALAAAYTISEKAFDEYKEKVKERLGESKEQKVRDEIAQDQVTKNPLGDREVIIATSGDQLFYETYTGRYFKSSMEEVKKAVNDTNYQLIQEMYASLGDFQRRVGLPMTDTSEEVGWTVDEKLDVDFAGTISDDQRPCIAISYRVAPVRGYYRFQ